MSFINSRMSSARQAVHRADNLTGFGKRPDLTPSHQLVLPSGITLNTCGNRKNPVCGISCISTSFSVPASQIRTLSIIGSRLRIHTLRLVWYLCPFRQLYHERHANVSENRTESQFLRLIKPLKPHLAKVFAFGNIPHPALRNTFSFKGRRIITPSPMVR